MRRDRVRARERAASVNASGCLVVGRVLNAQAGRARAYTEVNHYMRLQMIVEMGRERRDLLPLGR